MVREVFEGSLRTFAGETESGLFEPYVTNTKQYMVTLIYLHVVSGAYYV